MKISILILFIFFLKGCGIDTPSGFYSSSFKTSKIKNLGDSLNDKNIEDDNELKKEYSGKIYFNKTDWIDFNIGKSSFIIENYIEKFSQKFFIKAYLDDERISDQNFNKFCINSLSKIIGSFESVINPLNQPFLMRKLELNKKYGVCYVRNPFTIKEKRVEIESDIFNESEKAELKIILESFSVTTDGSIFISLFPYISLNPDPNEELFLRLICALGDSKALIHFYLLSTDERQIHTVIDQISFEDPILK